eukprot:4314540-Prymnesium_polylepis.1
MRRPTTARRGARSERDRSWRRRPLLLLRRRRRHMGEHTFCERKALPDQWERCAGSEGGGGRAGGCAGSRNAWIGGQ